MILLLLETAISEKIDDIITIEGSITGDIIVSEDFIAFLYDSY